LIIIGLLTVLCQLLIQPILKSERDQIPVINIAGAQRMMSQEITKVGLALQSAVDDDELHQRTAELRAVLAAWPRVHEGLKRGELDGELGIGLKPYNTPAIVGAFADLDPHFHAIHAAAEGLVGLADGATVATLDRASLKALVLQVMAHESPFLKTMDRIVSLYDQQAREALARLERTTTLLAATMLTVLALTVFLVFRPATTTIRRQLSQLRESEARFRVMADTAPVMIWMSGPDQGYIYFNKGWLDFTGRTLEQELGYGWAEDIHPDDQQRRLRTYAEAFNARRDLKVEYRLRRFDGDYRWLLEIATPRFEPDGSFAGYIGSCIDITERKLAEQERERWLAQVEQERQRAQEAAARLDTILMAIADGLLIYDQAGNIVRINPSAERLLGNTDEWRKLPQRAEFCKTAAGEPAVLETLPIWRALQGSTIRNEVLVLRHLDQEPRWLSVSAAPIPGTQSTPTGAVATLTDITERRNTEAALRESEERFRATFEQAAVGMAHVAPDGRWLNLNQRLCDILGYSREELADKTFADITHPEDLEADLAQVRRLLQGETQRYSMEKRYIHKNGAPIWANLSVSLLRAASGDPKYFISVIEDITARKQAEEETRARVHQQAMVADLGQRALAGAEPQELMDEACTLLAQTLNVEHTKVLELLPGGDALLLRAGVGWREGLVGKATVSTGSQSQAGYTLLSNQPVIVEDQKTETRFSGPPLLHDHGVVSGMSVIIPGRNQPFGVLGVHATHRRRFSRDDLHFLQSVANVLATAIERKRAEAEITSWKDRYETAVTASGLVLYDWDTRTGHVTFGGSYRETLGYFEQELTDGARHWLRRVHPQDRKTVVREAKRLRATRDRIEFEYRVRRRDGEYIYVRMVGHFCPDTASGHPRMIGFLSDITQRKRVERMKNEFVSTVSHELRTPLTSIAGSLGLLNGGVAGELPDKAKALVEIAYRNSERLVRLITDILDIDKIESGKMDFALQPVDLMLAIDEALVINRAFAAQFKVQLALEQGLPGVKVYADPDRLMQVLTNLLSNAAKFSPPGETVTVRAIRVQDSLRVAITDRGPGIPEEFRDRIFQKFAQADTSDARAKGGTGLGLSIAKAIVEKFGGHIGFESRVGVGTTFYVDLPEWQGT
jgi:PAS domain S-box-containing protein